MQRRVQKFHNVHVCSVAPATYGHGVLPLWRLRVDEGGTLLQGPAQRFHVNGDPSLSAVRRTYPQMAMGSILLQSKGMSFTPVGRDGQRGERWQDMVYIHTAQGGWRF